MNYANIAWGVLVIMSVSWVAEAITTYPKTKLTLSHVLSDLVGFLTIPCVMLGFIYPLVIYLFGILIILLFLVERNNRNTPTPEQHKSLKKILKILNFVDRHD